MKPYSPHRNKGQFRKREAWRSVLTVSTLCAMMAGSVITSDGHATDIDLPELGDSTSGIVSLQQEKELGTAWLASFRRQVKVVDDPLLEDYLEDLVYRLVIHNNQLKERDLQLVVVSNPTINAFAVPGGVIGVHDGLLQYAQNEDQLAAVLAHELGHLSQRHFARSLEEQRSNSLPMMAALLGSLVLMATAGGDAGIAALSASQAAAIQNQLRFSRENEQEADRIGMATLAAADMNPEAVANMFEQMLRAYRFAGSRPPEFLLTHPVTESRVADARSRAGKYGKTRNSDNFEFYLMQARVRLSFESSPTAAVKRFRSELEKNTGNADANHYGLGLSLAAAGQFDEARKELSALYTKSPQQIPYVVSLAELEANALNYDAALKLLERHLAVAPDNHPLSMTYAQTLLRAGRPKDAERVLVAHVKRNAKKPEIWYLLAETHGLAGNIPGVHQARAEYFVLNGIFDQAQRQLQYALPLVKDDYQTTSRIQNRIREIEEMKRNNEF